MVLRWIRAVVLLPGMALAVFAPGLVFGLWTMALFQRHGEGTAAPWDPPTRLVVCGPYRHVRNPMISGVCLMLLGETLLFASPALAAWLVVFATANAVYLPRVEERGLLARFGADYERYRRAVPRWLPRLRPWIPDADA